MIDSLGHYWELRQFIGMSYYVVYMYMLRSYRGRLDWLPPGLGSGKIIAGPIYVVCNVRGCSTGLLKGGVGGGGVWVPLMFYFKCFFG